jgi:hypothetical protein
MNKSGARREFPVGLVLLGAGILLYKAARVSLEMSGSLSMAGQLALLDLDLLGLLLLLGLATALSRARILRLTIKSVLLLSVLFYAIHSFVLLELNEYMSLFDLARYLPEWRVVHSFLGPLALAVICLWVLAAFLDLRISRRQQYAVAAVALAMLAAGLIYMAAVPAELRRYSLLQPAALIEQVWGAQPASSYTPAQHRFYRALESAPVEFIDPEPNIILLVVESLSSINSYRTSGALDLLPDFDRLSTNGLLFRNFFANHGASEGGLIALLSGFPPLHYPTASPLMFDEFAAQRSVIGAYQEQGYYTEFLTNTDLGFIGMDRYIDGLGLDLARGRDEVPGFAGADRYVQDAPSDRNLYTEALQRVERHLADTQPWIMVIATVSTHLPYTHPEGGEDAAQAVWDWSMDRLVEFHQGLEASGFYRNGLLLITGDHRQMRPLTEIETRRYGDSAKARVPLLVLGRDMPAGRIDDRYFQQSDLLRYLARVNRPGQPLSPNPIWVERYNRIYGKVDSINRFSVFDAANEGLREYPVQVLGTRLEWQGSLPEGHRSIEARIHAQRSAHQFARNGEGLGCANRFAEPGQPPPGERGLKWKPVGQASLGDVLDGSPRQLPESPAARPTGSEPGAAQLFWFSGYLQVARAGTYWFRAAPGNSLCLGIDQRLIIDQPAGAAIMQAPVELETGLHAVDLRYFGRPGDQAPGVQWITPGTLRWRWREVPAEAWRPAPMRTPF